MNVTTATPAEIDTEIFAHLQEAWKAQDEQERLITRIRPLVGDKKVYSWNHGQRNGVWTLRRDEVQTRAQDSTDASVADLYRHFLAAQTAEELARDAIAPLDAEYHRRSRWTRAYLVDNADGHVHRTDRCSSFRWGTRFHWLTDLSGQAETQIVELAGERACTICYPSAPVDVLKRPSKLEGPAQAAAREAAAVRAAEKAARAAKKAEKAITNPDGSVLHDQFGPVATVVSAWNRLVDNIFCHRAYGYSLHVSVNDRIVAALAAKTGTSVEEITATAEAKVVAKAKREKVAV